jgi:hypothetical protein
MPDDEPHWLPLREHLDRHIRPQLIELMGDPTVDPYIRAHLAAFLDQAVAKCIDQVELSMLRRRVASEDRVVHLPFMRAGNGGAH